VSHRPTRGRSIRYVTTCVCEEEEEEERRRKRRGGHKKVRTPRSTPAQKKITKKNLGSIAGVNERERGG
jgi:hypothetical protein